MNNTTLYRLAALLSPAAPTGGFAWSHGLETAIGEGLVHDADTLTAWLSDVLEQGGGWSDAVLLAATLRGEDTGALALALAPSAERLSETREQGAAFARMAAAWGIDAPDAALPVAVGVAARHIGAAPEAVITLYLHAFTANLVSAAVRLVPLGQSSGQAVLAALDPVVGGIAAKVARSTLDNLGTCAILADTAAMRHETRTVRLFRS